MARGPWKCRCGHRNEAAHVNCRGDGCNRHRPPLRTPAHARQLQAGDDAPFVEANQQLHGQGSEHCGCCGRHTSECGRLFREHDHGDGTPRGLACFHCNRHLIGRHTLDSATLVVQYLLRAAAVTAGETVTR